MKAKELMDKKFVYISPEDSVNVLGFQGKICKVTKLN